MKKIICILMAMLCLSVPAMASQKMESFSLQYIEGEKKELSSLYDENLVLIFGRMGEMLCGNTRRTVESANSLLDNAPEGFCAIYLEMENRNTEGAVSKNMKDYPNVAPCVQSGGYDSIMWKLYKRVEPEAHQISLPLTVFIKNGEAVRTLAGRQNEDEMKKNLIELFGLTEAELAPKPLEDGEIHVEYQGTLLEFDQKPLIQNGRTLVPVRKIFEALGAEVAWDPEARTVTATRGARIVRLRIGSSLMFIDDAYYIIDEPAQIIGDRTFVPARAVAEAFDCQVDWIQKTRTVVIK